MQISRKNLSNSLKMKMAFLLHLSTQKEMAGSSKKVLQKHPPRGLFWGGEAFC